MLGASRKLNTTQNTNLQTGYAGFLVATAKQISLFHCLAHVNGIYRCIIVIFDEFSNKSVVHQCRYDGIILCNAIKLNVYVMKTKNVISLSLSFSCNSEVLVFLDHIDSVILSYNNLFSFRNYSWHRIENYFCPPCPRLKKHEGFRFLKYCSLIVVVLTVFDYVSL